MLKATGVVRKIDDLGRIVIPMELRRTHGIEDGDGIEIFTNEHGDILLRKYQPGCSFCNSMEPVFNYRGKPICADCATEITNKFKKVG